MENLSWVQVQVFISECSDYAKNSSCSFFLMDYYNPQLHPQRGLLLKLANSAFLDCTYRCLGFWVVSWQMRLHQSKHKVLNPNSSIQTSVLLHPLIAQSSFQDPVTWPLTLYFCLPLTWFKIAQPPLSALYYKMYVLLLSEIYA